MEEPDDPRLGAQVAPSSGSGFAATYSQATSKDILRLVRLSQRDAVVTFTGADGTCGQLQIAGGDVVGASLDGRRDVRLLPDVLAISGGQAHVTFDPEAPPDRPPNPPPPEAESGSPASLHSAALVRHSEGPRPWRVGVPRSARPSRAVWIVRVVLVAGALISLYRLLAPGKPARQEPIAPSEAASAAANAAPPAAVESGPPGGAARQRAQLPRVLRLDVTPAHAEIFVDGERFARGSLVLRLGDPHVAHVVRLQAPGYVPKELTFLGALPPERQVLDPLPVPEPPRPAPPVSRRPVDEVTVSTSTSVDRERGRRAPSAAELARLAAVSRGRLGAKAPPEAAPGPPEGTGGPGVSRSVRRAGFAFSAEEGDAGRLPRVDIIKNLPEVEIIQ